MIENRDLERDYFNMKCEIRKRGNIIGVAINPIYVPNVCIELTVI